MHNILLVSFLVLEILATFQPRWIPGTPVNLVAAGLACFAASMLF